jgi:flagellar biosynthesis/type III secretory pathway protein FliH
LRSLSVTFKDEVLEFYDLKLPRVVDVVQTKVPIIEVKDRDMDINFILADNTIAHLEFESSEPTLEDQIRYGHYDLELYKQRRQKIHRIVIYSAGINQVPKPLDIGSIRQSQIVIYLESMLQEPEKSKILEVLRMAQPFQELYQEFEDKGMKKGLEKGMEKGIEKGMEKGRTEGKQESACMLLAIKFGTESTKLQERIKRITDETALDRLIEELIVTSNIQDATKVIETLN